jgi:hypothetical protein
MCDGPLLLKPPQRMYVGVVRGASAMVMLPGGGFANRSHLFDGVSSHLCDGVRELCRALHACEAGTYAALTCMLSNLLRTTI